MKIKVCGLNEPKNIAGVLKFDPDMVGFIFYQKSPRLVNNKILPGWIEDNSELFGEAKRVGVFVDAKIDFLLNAVHDYQLDFVQLHGTERPEYCNEIQDYWNYSSIRKAKFIKAFQVDEDFDFNTTQAYENLCAYFLFDTKSTGHGGSGKKFDWSVLKGYKGMTPFILSGGIGPDDAQKIKKLNLPQMSGVDINSRFESTPGVKNLEEVSKFIDSMRS